jgi:light-harvesting complex 1 beta chain
MSPAVSMKRRYQQPYHGVYTMAEQASLSGLTDQQAKEFHEQFKITYTAYVGLAALVHLFIIAANPWF